MALRLSEDGSVNAVERAERVLLLTRCLNSVGLAARLEQERGVRNMERLGSRRVGRLGELGEGV